MNIDKILAELQDRANVEAEKLITPPTVTFKHEGKGVIEFNKEALIALGSHTIEDSEIVEQNGKSKTINVYGKNRVATWQANDGDFIIALTNCERLNTINTSKLTLNGKCKDTLQTSLYSAVMGDAVTSQEFLLEDITVDAVHSLAVLVPKGQTLESDTEGEEVSDVTEDELNNALAFEDSEVRTIADDIEEVGDYIQNNVDVDVVSYHTIPTIPEIPAQ